MLIVGAPCYALGLFLSFPASLLSRQAHAIVGLAFAIPGAYVVFFLISKRLEWATIHYLTKEEGLYCSPLVTSSFNDHLFE